MFFSGHNINFVDFVMLQLILHSGKQQKFPLLLHIGQVALETLKQSTNMHYENMPLQYTESFLAVKIENFIRKKLMLLIFMLKTLIVCTC